MDFYWDKDAPIMVYHGISTRPGMKLSEKEKLHFRVMSKLNSKGECTVELITTKKPFIPKKDESKGGGK